MTKEEALEKYGNVPLRFSGYYKYSFNFVGTASDGAEIFASLGGNADDIYRLNIKEGDEFCLNKSDFYYIRITLNNKEIFHKHDF